jgi:3-oxoacyl-(acyl-carrier-protein) synthase/SAM-dependent methyltransferase/acyl carrier protein
MAKKNLAEKIDLIESVLLLLPEILTSRVNAPVALLPKAGSISGEIVLAGGLGTSSLVKIMADIVNDYIHERLRHNHETKIRILEIGAGANSAIQLLLENLEPVKDVIEEYNITDISANSLHKIEKRVGKSRVNLRFGCFNAEFGPEDQDIATGVYDIVIAVDALQSAQNIRKRLRNIKMALKKNGLLLLKEIGQDTVISLITDGFLHVNGECDDSSERLNARPLLNPASLKILCELEGFRRINSPVSTFHRLGQHIIMAESDGVMRIESDQIAPEEKTAEGSSASTAMNASVPVIQSGESLRTGDLNQRVTRLIKDIIGDVLKIPPARMRNDEPFEKYGIDSISINQVTNRLSDILGTISSTLLFEYQTVESLVDHLVLTQREKLVNLLGGENTSNVRQENHAACSEKKPSLIKTSAKINNRRILRSGRSSHANVKEYDGMEIAVIGMAGRYAQAENVEEFWNNLCAGRNCITEIPIERWNWRDHFSSQKGQWGTMYSKWGGFMKQVDKFDHQFFNISLLEAEWMDPQERLFLETAYESIEDSGYIPSGLCASRKVGVFVGVMNSYYPSGANFHSVANRVSYHCDFKGPSVAIDTACSSSLTAVHFAIESLASGTSEIAIAGGVNVIIDPTHYIKLSAMGMLSPNDKCKAFGENADGIVGGEGVGAVVLKPLTKALAGNDNIYGVIKGSMINSGGKTHGFTVPNPVAHSELIEGAINKARVNARRISYVEAHGTGTELGDPIEITGLTRSFSKHTNEKQFCAIGSVKSNIGHCESAAGIASLTKVLLQLRNKRLVPSLHTQQTNSKIDFAATPFVVQSELVDWGPTILESDGQQKKYLRMAGVSSFGAGGANAHLIVEECDYNLESEKTILPDQSQNAVILLSAKNESSLKRYAERLLRAINSGKISNDNLQDVAYTLQVGRTAMEERLAFVARSVKEFDEKLSIFIGGDATAAGIFRGNALRSQTRLTKEIEWDAADIDIYSPAQFERMAELWTNGVSFDWIKIYAGVKRKRVSLPTYPFERKRCWTISNLLGQGSKNITEKGIPSILSLIDSSLNDLRISHCDANARDSVDTKEALDGLQELCEIMVLKTFREKEIILEAGTYEKKELRNKFFIVPEYFRLFDAILGILQRAGYIVLDTEGSIAVCEKAFRTETINKIERIQYYADDLIKRIPEIDSAIRLLTRCTNALLDVISGKKGSSEVMFPGGNVDLVRDVYKSYREYSELVSDVVKLCLKEMLRLDAKRTIRILEVGAGTGETTDCIVQAIGEFQENIQYLYTDISPIFVKNGKSHFTSKCDYMSFYVHDIEKSHIGQSIEEQSVDIIIAANVLHAMQRVDDTLQHIKGLLKPNGTLIVLEITKVFDYGTLTFGLTKGWWSYKDEELRLKDSPLLGRSGWTKSLEGNGFNHIRIVDFWRDSLFSQNVILAESNGVVEKQRVEIVLPANKTESTQTQSIAIQPSAIEGDSSAQSEIERSIAAIWKEILGVEQIGRFDSFQDLGGDSIVATQMISRLKGLFPFDLDLSGLFNARTVAGMAELIEEELMKRIDEMPEDAVKGLLSPELPQKR